jgi:hypothetical protein
MEPQARAEGRRFAKGALNSGLLREARRAEEWSKCISPMYSTTVHFFSTGQDYFKLVEGMYSKIKGFFDHWSKDI